jgi:hypothetical protein
LLGCAGRRRSPATLSSFHQGRTPHNNGLRYPPDPPSVEEIIITTRSRFAPWVQIAGIWPILASVTN